jgi:hypothetical protein
MHRALTAVIVSVCVATTSAAQPAAERLFAQLNRAQSAASIRLDLLFDTAADRVLLNVGGHEWVAKLDRIDRDLLGHRAWVGSIEGIPYSHVSFAERNGIVSGLINALGERYQVRTIAPGQYVIEPVSAGGRERESEPLQPEVPADRAQARISSASAPLDSPADGIDVLLLYTAAARARVGGVAQMQALLARIVSDSNTAFRRSAVPARLRLAGAIEVPLTESTNFDGVLRELTATPVVRAAREYFHADLVQLLVSSPTAPTCGVAWLLGSLDIADFDAYSVADVDCAPQYTPTHEMGHNMGSHHAPEDGAIFALFPYSFAYKDPARKFRTLMAYACPDVSCPRIPSFSDPALLVDGGPSGTPLQNNAQSLRNAVPTIANLRRSAAAASPPAAPTAPLASVDAQTVTLSCNPVGLDVTGTSTAITGYGIALSSATAAFPPVFLTVGNTTALSGVLPVGTYVWRVFAYNAAGTGPGSDEQTFTVASTCALPDAPQNVRFTQRGNIAGLMWTAATTGAQPARYIIEVGSAAGLADLYVAALSDTSLETAVPPGVYFVRVRAANQCGVSSSSAEKIVVVQ